MTAEVSQLLPSATCLPLDRAGLALEGRIFAASNVLLFEIPKVQKTPVSCVEGSSM